MTYYHNLSELYHHGIKGQRWGVRRFQNSDGSLKAAGKKRYGDGESTKKPSRAERRAERKAKAAAALKTTGKVLQKAAKVASGVSVDITNKYGSLKVGDFSDEAKNEGENIVDKLKNVNIVNIISPNVIVEKRVSPEDIIAAKRKEKYDSLPKEVKDDDDIGEPSGKPIDKSSKEYSDLFKDKWNEKERKPETRKLIKDMADAGYDVEQIERKLHNIDFNPFSPYNEDADYNERKKWEAFSRPSWEDDDD